MSSRPGAGAADPSPFEMTRASYDTVAADYADLVGDLFTRMPVVDSDGASSSEPGRGGVGVARAATQRWKTGA